MVDPSNPHVPTRPARGQSLRSLLATLSREVRSAEAGITVACQCIGNNWQREEKERATPERPAGRCRHEFQKSLVGKSRQALLVGSELVGVGDVVTVQHFLVPICDYRSQRSHRLLKRRRLAPSIVLHEAMFDMSAYRVSSSFY